MLHECHYCHEHKSIQAFHNDPEDQICQVCHDSAQFDKDMQKAFILAERARIKEMLKAIDEEELPF